MLGAGSHDLLRIVAMTAHTDISKQYTHGDLAEAIRAGVVSQGKTPETIDDLSPIDEFHIGGRRATEDFLDQLTFSPCGPEQAQHHPPRRQFEILA
jgi:hypothetical protein